MEPSVANLESKSLSPEILEIFEKISSKQIPASALTRFWAVGSMQAKVFMGYLTCWLKSGFADRDRKEVLRGEAHLAAGMKLLSTMGYMRGAVMKVGQLLANLPDVVPEEIAEVLGALHFEAPPMHYAMIREVFMDETGADPEDLFADFERQAFAAASLGQVHRARLKTGEMVAVKIQYPHMAQTIRSDMANLRLIMKPLSFSADWQYINDSLLEVEEMLLMEADFRQEAQYCIEAGKLFDPQDGIVIPVVHKQYSSERILTMEYIPGVHLREYLAGNPSQENRDRYADLLSLVSLRLYYSGRHLFADPNPGNFLFMPDGRLGVIDFGCTRVFSAREWQLQFDLEKAFFENDETTLRRLIGETCYLTSSTRENRDQIDNLFRALKWHLHPMAAEGLFDWGDGEFFRQGVDIYADLIRKRQAKGMPLYIWTNRFIFGFRAICYRLGGRNYFSDMHHREKRRLDHGLSA